MAAAVQDRARADVAASGDSAARDGWDGQSSYRLPSRPSSHLVLSRPPIADIQRGRLLSAAMTAVDKVGYPEVTISHIADCARVSRRTFYDLFDNREQCLSVMFEQAAERLSEELAAAVPERARWRDRVGAGLWAILCLFDREPVLARVCVVQSSRGEKGLLDRRAQVLARLAVEIDGARDESARGKDLPLLTAEGLVGAAHAIVYERILRPSDQPLAHLYPALMGMLVLPYLGAAAARREQMRPVPASPPLSRRLAAPGPAAGGGLPGLPTRLTYRTACALQAIALHPGISNRAVGQRAGIGDQGQISKLLARLERLALTINEGEGHAKGEANAWRLTPLGTQLAQSLQLRVLDPEPTV